MSPRAQDAGLYVLRHVADRLERPVSPRARGVRAKRQTKAWLRAGISLSTRAGCRGSRNCCSLSGDPATQLGLW